MTFIINGVYNQRSSTVNCRICCSCTKFCQLRRIDRSLNKKHPLYVLTVKKPKKKESVKMSDKLAINGGEALNKEPFPLWPVYSEKTRSRVCTNGVSAGM